MSDDERRTLRRQVVYLSWLLYAPGRTSLDWLTYSAIALDMDTEELREYLARENPPALED